jgi:hypothetical protein
VLSAGALWGIRGGLLIATRATTAIALHYCIPILYPANIIVSVGSDHLRNSYHYVQRIRLCPRHFIQNKHTNYIQNDNCTHTSTTKEKTCSQQLHKLHAPCFKSKTTFHHRTSVDTVVEPHIILATSPRAMGQVGGRYVVVH